MERGKHKVIVVGELGKISHNGRTYRIVRERIADTGEEYVSIKLYNAGGRFIKRFMMEPEIIPLLGSIFNWSNANISDALDEAERKAWTALGRYKLERFGYWSAWWIHLNRLSKSRRPNPWRQLVKLARQEVKL